MAQVPVVRDFEIKRTILTKKFRVEFQCPYCSEELVVQEKELEKQTEECPRCRGMFVLHPSAAKRIAADYEAEEAEKARKQKVREEEVARKREEAEQRRVESELRRQEAEAEEQRQVELDLRRQEAEAQEQQERHYNEQARLQREATRQAAAKAGAVGPAEVAMGRGPVLVTIEPWESRYPNLAKYLDVGALSIRITIAVAAAVLAIILVISFIGAISASDYSNLGWTLLFSLVFALLLWFAYIAGMAGIEFVKVICNIEHESAITRVAVQRLTQLSEPG